MTLALIVATMAGSMSSASAGATPCGGGSCITVTGSGLRVGIVRPQVMVPPLVAYYGHMETWGPGFHANTRDLWFSNTSNRSWVRLNGAQYNFNRDFPQGSKICSQFWRKNVPGNGQYNSLGVACVTVKR